MSLIWHDNARVELIEAAGYYGHIDVELGERFTASVEAAMAKLSSSSQMYRKFDGEVRKVRVERFPYAIIYWLSERDTHVVAVMNLHREPGYWRKRLD